MSKFVLAYTGGGMAATEEEQAAVMEAWGAWFGQLGDAVAEIGNPFATSAVVGPDGATSAVGPSGLTGYSVVNADSLDSATTLAKGCPVLASGGSVEVYEAIEM